MTLNWLKKKLKSKGIKMYCITCQKKKLRVDSSHSPHCSRCWLKTEEGRAFNSSKTKSFYIPKVSIKPRCLACNKVLRSNSNNGGYCFNCWESWTEEGKKYRCEKVKRSQAKNKKP
jgi:hypothetical protein